MTESPPIVVCDSDETSRQGLTAPLAAAGFTCITLQRGEEVLPTVRDRDADVVVLELTLADMPGIDVVTSVRAAETTLERRIFLIAVSSDRGLAEPFMDAGGDAFFSKPFNAQKLVVTVQRAVHRFRSKQRGTGRGADVPFEQSTMLQTTPPAAGVVVLRDESHRALAVEWTQNIRQRLQWFLVGEELQAREVSTHVRTADFMVTDDEKVAGAVFDHEVTTLDDFPRFTPQPPSGSCHQGMDVESITFTDHAMSLDRPIDAVELEQAKLQLDEHPDDPQAKDWFAFLSYRYGHHEEAIRHFAELVDGGSERSEHFFYLGCALAAVGNLEIAIEMWTKVAQREPETRLGRKCRRRIEDARAGVITSD